MKKVGRQFNLDGRIMAIQQSVNDLKKGMEVMRGKSNPDSSGGPVALRGVDLAHRKNVGEESRGIR